jgi:S1-C subfamily serine protease
MFTLLVARVAAQQPDLRPYVYHLDLRDEGHGGFGEGVFLSQDGEFLTALHLFEQSPHASSAFIQLYDGTSYVNHPVETVTSFSRALDIATVKIQLGGASVKIPPIGATVQVGETVYGFRPGIFELICTEGQVSAVSANRITIKGEHFLLQGSSGSPIFNRSGQVVAIALEMHPDHLYSGVPISKALSVPKLKSPIPLQDFLTTMPAPRPN